MQRREFITRAGLALSITITPLGLTAALAIPEERILLRELYCYKDGGSKFVISAELPINMSNEDCFEVLEQLAADEGIQPYYSMLTTKGENDE